MAFSVEQFPLVVGSFVKARGHKAVKAEGGASAERVRFARSLDELNRAIVEQAVTAAGYKCLKQDLNSAFQRAWDIEVNKPYCSGGNWKELPEELRRFDTIPPGLHHIEGRRSKAEKLAAHPMRDAMIALMGEYAPLAVLVESLKDKIVKRIPKTEEQRKAELAEKLIPKTPRSQKVYNVVRSAIESMRPSMVASFELRVTQVYEELMKKYGPGLKGAGVYEYVPLGCERASEYKAKVEQNSCAQKFSEIRPCLDNMLKLSASAMRKKANAMVDSTFANVMLKILDKAGEMEEPEIAHLSGYRFDLRGLVKGATIRIEQTITMNVSVNNVRFSQFPARIYMNGKFTPERVYKAWMIEPSTAAA